MSYKIPREAGNNPILEFAGTYGPGQTHEAECTIQDFKINCEPGDGPGYDPECEKDSYSMWNIKVVRRDGSNQTVFVRDFQRMSPNSGSRTPRWLDQLGVNTEAEFASEEELNNEVIGQKVIIEVTAPRTGKDGVVRTGYLRNVLKV